MTISRTSACGQADLHLHTSASDGVMSPRRLLDFVVRRTNLDVIAVTDHDEVYGALETRRIARDEGYPVDVIVGTEVTTSQGHLLGLFIEKRITMLKPLDWTVRAIRDQGGLVIVPHPLSYLTASVSEARLRALVARADEGLCPDALETLNPSIAGQVRRAAVAQLNRDVFQLAEAAGSDAHFLAQIGMARTLFPGRTADELRAALAARTTRVLHGAMLGRVRARELAEQQWRSMVWHPALKLRRALFPRFEAGAAWSG